MNRMLNCGSNSVVECLLAKENVEGSNPFSRSIFERPPVGGRFAFCVYARRTFAQTNTQHVPGKDVPTLRTTHAHSVVSTRARRSERTHAVSTSRRTSPRQLFIESNSLTASNSRRASNSASTSNFLNASISLLETNSPNSGSS